MKRLGFSAISRKAFSRRRPSSLSSYFPFLSSTNACRVFSLAKLTRAIQDPASLHTFQRGQDCKSTQSFLLHRVLFYSSTPSTRQWFETLDSSFSWEAFSKSGKAPLRHAL